MKGFGKMADVEPDELPCAKKALSFVIRHLVIGFKGDPDDAFCGVCTYRELLGALLAAQYEIGLLEGENKSLTEEREALYQEKGVENLELLWTMQADGELRGCIKGEPENTLFLIEIVEGYRVRLKGAFLPDGEDGLFWVSVEAAMAAAHTYMQIWLAKR